MELGDFVSDYGLEHVGLRGLAHVHWNLPTPALYEQAIRRYVSHSESIVLANRAREELAEAVDSRDYRFGKSQHFFDNVAISPRIGFP